MIDLFYKFPDQAVMLEALQPLGMVSANEEGLPVVSEGSHQYALWQVGEIAGLEGWHVNIRQIDMEMDLSSLDKYQVYPQQPVCVWA